MKARKYLICAEWLNNIMIAMLYFLALEWVYRLLNIKTVPIHAPVIGFILVCAYFSRVYIEKLLVYIGVHCLELVFLLFLPLALPYKVPVLLVFSIFSVCDLMFWTSEGVRSFIMIHPLAVTFILAVFAYASWHNMVGLISESYVCGILFVAMFFVRTYLLNAVKLAGDMQVNASTPLGEMFKNNGWMVFILVISFTVIMFAVRSESLAGVIRACMRFLADIAHRILIFILSLIVRGDHSEAGTGGDAGTFAPDLSMGSDIPVWLMTFLQAAEKVLILLILAAAVYFVVKGIMTFIRIYFIRHGYDLKIKESDDHIDLDERIKHTHKLRTGRILGAGSERERIRRKYRREVEGLRRSGHVLKRDHTPRERAADVGRDDFWKLTEKYENLRYGKS